MGVSGSPNAPGASGPFHACGGDPVSGASDAAGSMSSSSGAGGKTIRSSSNWSSSSDPVMLGASRGASQFSAVCSGCGAAGSQEASSASVSGPCVSSSTARSLAQNSPSVSTEPVRLARISPTRRAISCLISVARAYRACNWPSLPSSSPAWALACATWAAASRRKASISAACSRSRASAWCTCS